MKKLFSAIISAALFIAPIHAIAVVKASTSCSKQGATLIYANKKFTCIKSGKKLVWNKGVAIAKPVPAVTPPPSPTVVPSVGPTPTPVGTPSPTPTVKVQNQLFWKFKVVNGVLYRNVEATGEWVTTDSRNEAEFDPIRIKAWKQINTSVPATVAQNSVTYMVGPNVNPEIEASYRYLIDRSLKYFKPWIPSEVPFYVHIYTEKDRDYLKQSMQIYVNGEQDYLRLEADLKNYDGLGSNFSPSGGVTIGALKTDRSNWINFGTFPMDSELKPEDLLMYMIPHEVSHHWQFSVMQPLMRRQGSDRSACNFFEGTAVLLGSSVGVNHLGWFSDEMDVITRRISRTNPTFNPTSPKDMVEELMKFSSSNAQNALGCTTGYTLGALAYEWLVAEKGVKVLQDLADAFNKTSSVSEGIRLSTGWSDREFYIQASEYVLRAWQRAVNLKP